MLAGPTDSEIADSNPPTRALVSQISVSHLVPLLEFDPVPENITIRLTANRSNRRLLGAQMVGHWRTQISKRIDVVATALLKGMTVDELDDLDLSYTLPLGTPWDAIQAAGHLWIEFEQQTLQEPK